MNIRNKMTLDSLLVSPVAFMINWANLVHRAISPRHRSVNLEFKTIAICKFVGMGSVIQATPLMRALKAQFPTSKLVFVTTESLRPLFMLYNLVDEVICINDRTIWSLLLTISTLPIRLIRCHIDAFINLETYSHFSGVVAATSLARVRIGFFSKAAINRKGIFTQLVHINVRAPIAQVYLQTARALGCVDPNPTLPPIAHDPAAEKNMWKKLHDLVGIDADKPFILVNPNASDLRVERRWPPKRYAELVSRITTSYPDFTILFVGSMGEKAYNENILSGVFPFGRAVNAAGMFPLCEFVELIRRARLLITNDSGPMHLAAALRTPTVAFFGPQAPAHYGISGPSIILYANVYCSPCVHEFVVSPCFGNNHCMKSISVDHALEAVKTQLHSPLVDLTQYENIQYTATGETTPLGIVMDPE